MSVNSEWVAQWYWTAIALIRAIFKVHICQSNFDVPGSSLSFGCDAILAIYLIHELTDIIFSVQINVDWGPGQCSRRTQKLFIDWSLLRDFPRRISSRNFRRTLKTLKPIWKSLHGLRWELSKIKPQTQSFNGFSSVTFFCRFKPF